MSSEAEALSTLAEVGADMYRMLSTVPPDMVTRVALIVDAETWAKLEDALRLGGADSICSRPLNFRNIVILGIPVVARIGDGFLVRKIDKGVAHD